ncbi:hypothetical protein BGZ82_000333 [Podila clonocystis]|nr:hypothetical protein BGZ82_000333 [Podila clonocystis]
MRPELWRSIVFDTKEFFDDWNAYHVIAYHARAYPEPMPTQGFDRLQPQDPSALQLKSLTFDNTMTPDGSFCSVAFGSVSFGRTLSIRLSEGYNRPVRPRFFQLKQPQCAEYHH